MTEKENKRKGFLSRLLGEQTDEAEAIIENMTEVEEMLDEAGAERKELESAKLAQTVVTEALKETDGDAEKVTAESLVAALQTALQTQETNDDEQAPDGESEEEDSSLEDMVKSVVKDQGDLALMMGELIGYFKEGITIATNNQKAIKDLGEIIDLTPKQPTKDDKTTDILEGFLSESQMKVLEGRMKKTTEPTVDDFWDTGKNGSK